MSLSDPVGDTTHFLSDDSEGEEPGVRPGQEEESPSGVSVNRARLTVAVLFYINLLNYMDRFTVAGRLASATLEAGVGVGLTRLPDAQ
jgi:hypothetical protein